MNATEALVADALARDTRAWNVDIRSVRLGPPALPGKAVVVFNAPNGTDRVAVVDLSPADARALADSGHERHDAALGRIIVDLYWRVTVKVNAHPADVS